MTTKTTNAVQRIVMAVQMAGQAAAPFFDASEQVEAALTAVRRGDSATAVDVIKEIRGRLIGLQVG